MQSYKEWVSRWLTVDNKFGGELAKIIHDDPYFPISSDWDENKNRLIEIGASDRAMMVFYGSWKMYKQDATKKPSEASLERKLVHEVQKRGGLCWKFTSPGVSGVPDRIVIMPGGRVVFVEMKAPGKRMRPLQKKRADQIQAMGIPVYCLNSNLEISNFLEEISGYGI